ncbi:MAG: HupE/UreJ family protein [Polyangiales bacterium]
MARLVLLGWLLASGARAHDVMGTVLMVDLGHERVHLEVQLPVDELRLALGAPSEAGVQALPAPPAQLAEYVLAHVGLSTPAGAPFTLHARPGELVLHDARNWLHIEVDALPPHGASPRDFVLETDVIDHRVPSHRVFVFLRRDLEGGQLGAPRIHATLHYQSTRTRVRSQGNVARGFWTALQLGAEHIAEGSDHLLFLLGLLLPAALSSTGWRWGARRPAREAGLQVVRIVTAFTLGHSLTLLLATLGLARLPETPVETAIAASVLLCALHALVPLFPRREAWVALGFGLVHGLGFASALEGLGVDGTTLALTVLGFNLGVELLQIVIVLLTLPWIYVLQGTRLGTPLRVGGALLTGLVALAWIGERAFALQTPITYWFDRAFAHAWLGLLALALLGSLSAIRAARTRPRALPASSCCP